MAVGAVGNKPISNPSREFYVILEDTADARTTEGHLAHLGPGTFFGELAALDWG